MNETIVAHESIITITRSTFTRMRAGENGGAIYAEGGVINLKGSPENIFMNHVGSYSALQCNGCTLVITGDNTSLRGVGGAIQAYNNGKLIFTSGNVILSRNVIYVHKSEVTCNSGATVVLDGNTAESHGGGVCLESSSAQISRCNMIMLRN